MRPSNVTRRDAEFLVRLGAMIQERRLDMAMSQRDLAKAAGLSHGAIYLIEAGSRGIRMDTLLALARALQIHPRSFFADRIAVDFTSYREDVA